jgi:hypothetical protein
MSLNSPQQLKGSIYSNGAVRGTVNVGSNGNGGSGQREIVISDTVPDDISVLWIDPTDDEPDELQHAVNTALALAKASGEFDGKDGKDGEPGKDGTPGKDGNDYVLTDSDKQEIARQAANLVDVPTDDHINNLINTALGVIENGSY